MDDRAEERLINAIFLQAQTLRKVLRLVRDPFGELALLYLLVDYLYFNKSDCLILLLDEVGLRHTETVQQLNHLSIQIALPKSARPNYIQTQVLRFKLNLAASQLNLMLKPRLRHQYTFSTGESNLKSTGLGVIHLPCNVLCQLWMDIADTV